MPSPFRPGFVRIAFIFILVLLPAAASACRVSLPPEAEPAFLPTGIPATPFIFTPSPTHGLTTAPLPTRDATSGTADRDTCWDDSGDVKSFQVDSQIYGKPSRVNVYFPPCYSTSHEQGYPVLFLLHGQGQDENFWLDLGVAAIADHLIQTDQAAAFVIVMVYEEYHLGDILQSRFGNVLMGEIFPWAENNLAISASRENRAIGGNSRGAYWAFRTALIHWEEFGSAGIHSLPFFGEPNALRLWISRIPEGKMPRLYVDTGNKDRYLREVLQFQELLDRNQIPHKFVLQEGEHDESYWQAHLADYILWYSEPW